MASDDGLEKRTEAATVRIHVAMNRTRLVHVHSPARAAAPIGTIRVHLH